MKTLEQVIEEFLVSTEESAAIAEAVQGWIYAWDNKRIEMLEEENKRIKELEAELAEEQSTRNLLSDENRALRVRLEEVTAFLRLDTSGEESWNALADKAAKYDELRAKFPFLPGAVVWILQDGAIQRATVWRIGERVARVLLDEIAIDVDPSRLHSTADACRAAIPVEE